MYTFINDIIQTYSGITSGRVPDGELLYTKIPEVNLFAFANRLFHEDFSPINRALHHTQPFSSSIYHSEPYQINAYEAGKRLSIMQSPVDWREIFMFTFINGNVHHLVSCTINPLILEHIPLQFHHLWGEFSTFSAAIANHYKSAFFIPPGTHHYWMDRGSIE